MKLAGPAFALLLLAGCGGASERVIVQECPAIPDETFPIDELPAERPTQPEHVEPWWLEAEAAYASCRDAVDGYREILDRARSEDGP